MKNYIVMILIGILLVFSLSYNIYQTSKNHLLTSSLQIVNKRAEVLKQQHLKTIDSLAHISIQLDALVASREKENFRLRTKIQQYLVKDQEDEKVLNGITNTDSICSLFARYYPDNYSTSQTGH